jgi:hypothetical protein
MRLLTSGLEAFMERDSTVREAAVKRKSEKHLWWNALEDKPGHILKSKFPVVLRVPDKTAAFGAQVFQS